MLHWEPDKEEQPCPHCGSSRTRVTFIFLALVRYSCLACKKSFDVKVEPAQPSK
jgi:transposase-like protein